MKAQTSVYHPFPDSNAVWNFNLQSYCFANGTANEYYSITFSTDTVIGSQTYHKLITPFVKSFSTGICGGYPVGYKGAIRQDSAARKIFFVPPSGSAEQLLYDFNMQVGDTIQGYLDYFGLPSTVQFIDSVLIGSTFRKRWNLSCYGIQVIEGIGNTYGLIEYLPGCATDFPEYTLTCFSQNEATLYPDITNDCELITSVKSASSKMIVSTLFPNPFSSIATFTLDSEHDKTELKIYNTLGKQVRQQMINALSTTIYRDGLSNGIYFYQVTSEKGQLTSGKFVIK